MLLVHLHKPMLIVYYINQKDMDVHMPMKSIREQNRTQALAGISIWFKQSVHDEIGRLKYQS